MTRVLLQYLLPLLLPTVFFVAWVLLTRRGSRGEGAMQRLERGPWFWLTAAGIVLVAAVLAYVAVTGGDDPGGTYVPPRFEGGRIIPGEIK